MTHSKRSWSAIAVFIAAGTLAGCAAMRAAQVRQDYIRSQTQDFVYQRPIAEVWAAARQLLFERGYELENTGEAGTYTAETRWKYEGTTRTRYLVQAIKLDDKSCRLNLTYASGSINTPDVSSARDLDTEWLLLQQLEPDRAAQIASEANHRGEMARGG